MQNKSEEINDHLRVVKMIGVGDEGKIHKETVGVLMGIFLHKHPKSLIWRMFGMHSWLLFWANRKGNTAGRQKL